MPNEIQNILQKRLLQVGGGISVQIAADDAVAILKSVYERGRSDSERDLRDSIAKQDTMKYITKAEAMALLHKSENTLWKWNRKGYLTWIKRGGTIMYLRESVMAILTGKPNNCTKDENDSTSQGLID